MDTKHIHCMLEKMAEYGKCVIEKGAGAGNVNLEDAKKVVEMVGELAEAEYHALIAKEMRKEHEDEEAEEKYMLKMLKEEHGMSEEDGKRFYDAWRYKNGRFAPKGRGTRRGYEEPPYYHMIPDYRMDLADYKGKTAEEMRDMDRHTKGVMYYTEPVRTDGMKHDGIAKSDDRYSDGYDEGARRGYEDGYRDGERKGKMKSGGSRYEMAKRGYVETKEMYKGNTPQEKQEKMKSLENYMKELAEDVTDMISDATPEERNLLKQKMQVMIQKIS